MSASGHTGWACFIMPEQDCRLARAKGRTHIRRYHGGVVTQCGAVAQWLEQGTHNPWVVGSIPTGPTHRQ